MTRILLMLLLSVIRARRVSPLPSCPASCVVCSEDALICHRLAHIIGAADTTKALLLMEGSISSVQPASLSDLSNVSVIGLSHNRISVLGEQSFRNLPLLHTLLLDHNLLTSQALQGGALTNLTRLEVLALGHNLISMLHAGWFRGSRALRSLKLEGNLLTSLDSGSFPLNDLQDLESLDVSDNLIHHLHRESFGGLGSLQNLDLSRNRLSSAPAEAFSYLSWLTNLNLDLNTWNCSCQLLELAAFLSTFIQQPDKTLYNGRRMVCVSADNPAVTTVLELTEANCVPSNQNITVQVEARGSVTPRLYARDLAITAVLCFTGGVGLTLLVVLICYQVSQRKKLKESQRQKEERSNSVVNHRENHLDVSENKRELFLQAQRGQPWDRKAMTVDSRTDGHGGQFRSRADENGHVLCLDCSTKGPRGMGQNPLRARLNSRINTGMETEEEGHIRRMRILTEEDRRRLETQQGILSKDKLPPRGNTNHSFVPEKQAFSQRPEALAVYRINREMAESYRTDMEGKSRGPEAVPCESCHRRHRAPEQNLRHGRTPPSMRDSAPSDGLPSQYRQIDRGRNNHHHQFDRMKNTELRREARNVTFDLQSSRGREQGSEHNREEDERGSRDKERRRHKSSRSLKVKLNLNPLRKSKVHPKRKTEQGHSERSSSKKSKDKGQDRKERGEEREGKGRSGKTKGSSEKMKKSSKAKGLTEDGEEEEAREEGQKSTETKGGEQRTEGDRDENTHLENTQPGVSPRAAEQSATGPGHSTQGGSVQGAGLVLGAQPSFQQPLSLSAPDRDRTTNLSLLGTAGSNLTGSSLSQQAGSILLNTPAPGPNPHFPGGPGPSIATSIAINGASDSFSRAVRVGLMAPAASLLANTVPANPLLATHISPLHPSQSAGLASNLAANPPGNPAPVPSQNMLLPEDSSLVVSLKSDPGQGPGSQTGEGDHQGLTKAPPIMDGLSTDTTPAPVTTVENLSDTEGQTGSGPSGSTVHISAGGGAPGLLGGSVQAADVSGVSAAQSGSSTAEALLQQEYLSEEGGASPRRKLRLVLPEKTTSRPPTALERKIR
ncbi:uncharacterized protein lrrc53 [Trematomus bernacchii]|uniref:uncharacterized protein lrrc53 n=1 Tax=Trematomus bernacchii TaxID=40690 RepID=UPI00146C9FFF|nr:uncharacterized protein lrrc53 [Trematomus bernacchii]XP_033974324.1 uncharacterized protein lrrc53 [Trematomus bernacchii]